MKRTKTAKTESNLPPKRFNVLPEKGFPSKRQAQCFDTEDYEAICFIRGLENASRFGMEIEYTSAFLQEYKMGANAQEADWRASYEWDI